MQTGKRYYVLAIQRPYGNDAFIFGSPWPPEADWDNGERLFGPYSTYEEAKSVVNEIEVGNKCLQGELW